VHIILNPAHADGAIETGLIPAENIVTLQLKTGDKYQPRHLVTLTPEQVIEITTPLIVDAESLPDNTTEPTQAEQVVMLNSIQKIDLKAAVETDTLDQFEERRNALQAELDALAHTKLSKEEKLAYFDKLDAIEDVSQFDQETLAAAVYQKILLRYASERGKTVEELTVKEKRAAFMEQEDANKKTGLFVQIEQQIQNESPMQFIEVIMYVADAMGRPNNNPADLVKSLIEKRESLKTSVKLLEPYIRLVNLMSGSLAELARPFRSKSYGSVVRFFDLASAIRNRDWESELRSKLAAVGAEYLMP
jgi:hypothetical protein